jgi:hypothetical protein
VCCLLYNELPLHVQLQLLLLDNLSPSHLLPWLPLEADVWLKDERHASSTHALSQCLELAHAQRCTKVGHWHWVAIHLVAGGV